MSSAIMMMKLGRLDEGAEAAAVVVWGRARPMMVVMAKAIQATFWHNGMFFMVFTLKRCKGKQEKANKDEFNY